MYSSKKSKKFLSIMMLEAEKKSEFYRFVHFKVTVTVCYVNLNKKQE
jgi:hypothetical protein